MTEEGDNYPEDVVELMGQYLERFGESPPVVLMPFSWIRENVARALKEDKPLVEPEVPEGAVI